MKEEIERNTEEEKQKERTLKIGTLSERLKETK